MKNNRRLQTIGSIGLFITILCSCCHKDHSHDQKEGFVIPLSYSRDSNIQYNTAVKYREEYLKSKQKLIFLSGANEGYPVEGFRISKDKIKNLFAQDTNATELYVFFGLSDDLSYSKQGEVLKDIYGTPLRDFTVVFSVVKPCKEDCNTCIGGCKGEICEDLLYDYVDPCPDKCPKFK